MALDYLPSPGWAVIYGETPSASRWSELGENDDALATGAGIDNAAILARHLAPGAVGAAAAPNLWYEELGRVKLNSPAALLTLTGLPARKYMKAFITLTTPTASITVGMRFNNVSTNTYAGANEQSGAADTTNISANQGFLIGGATGAALGQYIFDITNDAALEKTAIGHATRTNGGAGSAPTKDAAVFKWASTALINRIDIIAGGGNFGTNSEFILLGHN